MAKVQAMFSHAVVHQPVLFAASYEWGDNPDKKWDLTAERDPTDTEFRLRDFEGKNPLNNDDPWSTNAIGELGKFKKALDPERNRLLLSYLDYVKEFFPYILGDDE